MCLVRKQADRFFGELQRLIGFALCERLASLVIGVIGRFRVACFLHRKPESLFASLAAGGQFRRRCDICVDALLRRRVAGEKPAQPALVAAFAKPYERPLQVHRTRWVITSRRHIAHAVLVGFELCATAVSHRQQLSCHARTADGKVAVTAVTACHARGNNETLQQHASRQLLRGVPGCCVHDLVTEHGGKFRLGLHFGQQAAIHRDLAAGQRPGVGHRIIQHDELVGQRNAAGVSEPLADSADVAGEVRVHIVRAAL